MAHYKLNAELREGTGSAFSKKLRREGIVPAVIYGGDQRTYPVQVSQHDITDLLKEAHSTNVLVDLTLSGADVPNKLVLLQDLQRNTLSGAVTHVDFQAVKEDQAIRATVPIHLHGEPEGVRMGGLLEQQRHDLEVSCLPKDLPSTLDFDVAGLTLGAAFHIGDATFPEGVKATQGPDVVIALVAETRTAKADAATGEDEAAPATEEDED